MLASCGLGESRPLGLTSAPVSWLYFIFDEFTPWHLAGRGGGGGIAYFSLRLGPFGLFSSSSPLTSPPHAKFGLFFSTLQATCSFLLLPGYCAYRVCVLGDGGLGPGPSIFPSAVFHIPDVLQPLPRSPLSSAFPREGRL